MRAIVILFLALGLGACDSLGGASTEDESAAPSAGTAEGDEGHQHAGDHHPADEAPPADQHGGVEAPSHDDHAH